MLSCWYSKLNNGITIKEIKHKQFQLGSEKTLLYFIDKTSQKRSKENYEMEAIFRDVSLSRVTSERYVCTLAQITKA